VGVQRVVLPRELAIAEIRKIRRQTTVELEAFVHGALWWPIPAMPHQRVDRRPQRQPRQCAQACRMTYELGATAATSTWARRNTSSARRTWRPTTAAAVDRGGRVGLKIEGRLKTPEYWPASPSLSRGDRDGVSGGRWNSLRDVEEMEVSFSRGFSQAGWKACDHQGAGPGLSSSKRGVFLGQITTSAAAGRPGASGHRAGASIKRGDGIVFEGDRSEDASKAGGSTKSSRTAVGWKPAFPRGWSS